MLKLLIVPIFTFFLSQKTFSQRLFYCDSTVYSDKRLLSGECPYFFNFLRGAQDSIMRQKIDTSLEAELINSKIKILAPINSNGKIDGVVEGFENSKKIFALSYKDGFPNGNYIQYENGDTLGYVEIITGKKEGLQLEYLYPGSLELMISQYRGGLLNGQSTVMKNNNVIRRTSYQNGLKDGADYYFYETGELDWLLIYQAGKVIDGNYYTLNKDGTIESEILYKNNVVVKRTIYNIKGEIWKVIEGH